MQETVKESIASASPLVPLQHNQMQYPYWVIPIILMVCFVVLKMFLYIKDEKRHGK